MLCSVCIDVMHLTLFLPLRNFILFMHSKKTFECSLKKKKNVTTVHYLKCLLLHHGLFFQNITFLLSACYWDFTSKNDHLSPCFSVVKYIKEMSAFFKGGSTAGPPVLDSPPATPQKQTDPALKETRTLPLRMCHVTCKQCPPDTEDRYKTKQNRK